MVRQTVYVLVLCWCVLSTREVQAITNQALLLVQKVQHFYQDTHNFVADFEQEVLWQRGQTVRFSKGKVWFEKPGRMRWQYTWPEPYLVVSDGRKIFFYSPRDKQVMILTWGKAFSPKLTLGFLNGRGDLLRDFRVVGYEELDQGQAALDLLPQRQTPQLKRLRLIVNRKDGLIKAVWFWDCLDNLTKINFKHVHRNIVLAQRLFLFSIPKGVEVIRQE